MREFLSIGARSLRRRWPDGGYVAIVEVCGFNDWLLKLLPEYLLHADVERRLREKLAEQMSGGPGRTVSEIRELLGTTRKYAVPICEYLDRIGFTRREGDLRFLVKDA